MSTLIPTPQHPLLNCSAHPPLLSHSPLVKGALLLQAHGNRVLVRRGDGKGQKLVCLSGGRHGRGGAGDPADFPGREGKGLAGRADAQAPVFHSGQSPHGHVLEACSVRCCEVYIGEFAGSSKQRWITPILASQNLISKQKCPQKFPVPPNQGTWKYEVLVDLIEQSVRIVLDDQLCQERQFLLCEDLRNVFVGMN